MLVALGELETRGDRAAHSVDHALVLSKSREYLIVGVEQIEHEEHGGVKKLSVQRLFHDEVELFH